jgi:ABC-type multidrug transport system permease subunit
VSDVLVIAELQLLRTARPFWGFLIGTVMLPLPMLFFARYLLGDVGELGPRLIAGSIVFSVGLNTVRELAQILNMDRFTYRLTLIRGCPIHPFSYAGGMILAAVSQAVVNAGLVLLCAPLFGIDIALSLWFLPIVILTALSLAGIALVIGTWSPSWEVGNSMAQVVGVFIVLLSPIYFPVSRLPDWLQAAAHLSPYTYAANALAGILSGRGGFQGDAAMLAAITAAALAIGLGRMRWRET